MTRGLATSMSVCTTQPGPGAPCANRGCQLASTCDDYTGICDAKPAGYDDTLCTASTECKSHACDRGRCVPTTSAGTPAACHGETATTQPATWHPWIL